MEQADQPDGVDVDDLGVLEGRLRDSAATVAGIGETVLIEADAVPGADAGAATDAAATDAGATTNAGATTRTDPVTLTAIPYFQWDNRDGRAMRVWIPAASPPAADSPAPGH